MVHSLSENQYMIWFLAARKAQERFEANKSRKGSPTKISREGKSDFVPEMNGCASKMAFLESNMEYMAITNGSAKNDDFKKGKEVSNKFPLSTF